MRSDSEVCDIVETFKPHHQNTHMVYIKTSSLKLASPRSFAIREYITMSNIDGEKDLVLVH